MERLKNADGISRNIVNGFIRKSYPQSIVPNEICHLCLQFYYEVSERFVECSKQTEIITDGCIARIKDTSVTAWEVVQGNIIIDPSLNANAVIEWTITVNATHCIIGIHSRYSVKGYNVLDYQWHGQSNAMPGFNKHDVIKMELNLPQRKLLFYINNVLSRVMFNDIDMSREYHLVLKMNTFMVKKGDQESIHLTGFNVEDQQCLFFHK